MKLVIEGATLEDIEGQLIDALTYLNKGGGTLPATSQITKVSISPDEPPFPSAPPSDDQPGGRNYEEHRAAASPPLCPDGHGPMNFRPAGVSKTKFLANGQPKPYDAFYGCRDRACKRTAPAA